MRVENLNLDRGSSIIRDGYIKYLKDTHFLLKDKEDELLWDKNYQGGHYTPRLGYIIIREEEDHPLPP